MKPTTLLLDTDRGSVSLQDDIDSGAVQLQELKNYQDADNAIWTLLRADKDTLPKYIAFDSLDSLATRALEDIKLPLESSASPGAIWAEVGKKDGFTATQPEYGKLASAVFRLLWNLESLGIPTVFTCGEGMREDGPNMTERFGPSLSPKLRDFVMRYADVVGRLGVLTAEKELKDIDGKMKKYPKGTRALLLESDDTFHAKSRVRRTRWESGKYASILAAPTLPRLYENLGHEPKKILIYGPAGVGKTTLAGSGQ
jgi:hypothetical protein